MNALCDLIEVYVQMLISIPDAFITDLLVCHEPSSNLHSYRSIPTKSVPLKSKLMSLEGVLSSNLIASSHPTDTFPRVVSGGVVSLTVIIKSLVPVFPALSVALHCTLVWPRGNVDPDGGLQLTLKGPSTMSVAFELKFTVLPKGPVASRMRSLGTNTVGGVVSLTVIEKDFVVLDPSALHKISEVPIGKIDPDAGLQSTVIFFPDASVADTE